MIELRVASQGDTYLYKILGLVVFVSHSAGEEGTIAR